jgi:hypothetical protein
LLLLDDEPTPETVTVPKALVHKAGGNWDRISTKQENDTTGAAASVIEIASVLLETSEMAWTQQAIIKPVNVALDWRQCRHAITIDASMS